ncbi:MAG: divergent polysaccharide deacetylase family protein [Geobacteraceae bacterium]|nr:divergent polysaccharide deacetylase family protein [Geobacteraceae bacterium]
MAVRRKTARNRRRKKGNRRPILITLAVALLVVCGALYLLDRFTRPAPVKTAEKSAAAERQKIPPRITEQPAVLGEYSSAVLPPPEGQPKKPLKVRRGTVAIIVDDMGSSMHEADQLLAINVPITFSIIPGLARVEGVAQAAHRKGGEVMVHIPMEPKGYRQKPFEKNGLLLELSDEEIEKRLEGFIRAVPHATGANNHMGSRFTEERGKMQTVLGVLKGKGMFFIDSKTTPVSVADRLAREMGVPVASRNVFLDNEQDVAAIRVQIEKLAAMAMRSGSAIGICHPHKATLQALALSLPALKAEGINFVYASALVR